MHATALTGGFQNAPTQSSIAFRTIMNAMAKPATIAQITGATPPKGMSVACGTLLLTLCDPDTKIHLAGEMDTQTIRDWLTFHTGAPLTDAPNADFAVGTWDALNPITQFPIGTDQYPDRSTSLVVEMHSLQNTGATLSGPGIQTETQLSLPAITPFQLNTALFPLGCDFYFTAGDQIAALPRSTRVKETPCT